MKTKELLQDISREGKEEREFLENPNILELIDKELDKKIVKEHEARKTIFLVSNMRNVSNLNKATDNLLVNAVSGTGKDHISEAVFELLPFQERVELVKVTPKTLSYTKNRAIKGQELETWQKTAMRLEDVGNNVLNDDAFKVFLSANPEKINYGKSFNRGKVTEIAIHGKPSIILTIANPYQNEETLRRLPICFLDEGIDQTKEILKRQAEFAEKGKSLDYDLTIKRALQSLERRKVLIPYAHKLTKIFNPSNVIVRTAFPRFLDYIKSSCVLHQFQREMNEEGYLIATSQDYNIAAMMLRKTTSNILMIPLSKTREKIYNIFKNHALRTISLGELEEMEEIQEIGIGERWIRSICDWLVSKKLLKRETKKELGIDKPIYVYSYVDIAKFDVPTWENLEVNELFELNEPNMHIRTFEQKEGVKPSSNSSINSFTSNSSNSSNTKCFRCGFNIAPISINGNNYCYSCSLEVGK